MTVRISTDIHFDAAGVRHVFRHRARTCDAYGVLKFGPGDANLYFDSTETIDAVIAELVALRNEMAPPPPPATDDEQYRAAAGDEDDPRCKCGHPQVLHDEDGKHECHAVGPGRRCGCNRWRSAGPLDPPAEVLATMAARGMTELTAGQGGVLFGPFGPFAEDGTAGCEIAEHPDLSGPAFGEAELRRADAYRA